MWPELIPLVIAAPLLVWMAVSDMVNMLIPNRLVLAMVVVFAVAAPFTLDPMEVVWRLVVAAAVFAVGFVLFALNAFAGGDVKGLSVLMLFVPTTVLTTYAFAFSAAMLIGIALTLALRKLIGGPDHRFVSLATNTGFPMGVSIALSGLMLPFVVL